MPRKLPPHCKMVINKDTHMLRHFRIKHIAHLGPFSTRREWAEAVNQEDIKGLEEGNSYMYAKHVIATFMHVHACLYIPQFTQTKSFIIHGFQIYLHILTATSGPSSTATRHEDDDTQRKYSTTQTQNLDIDNLHPTFKA